MGISELAAKGVRFVYAFVKWTLGTIAVLVLAALVFSLGQQWLIKRSVETGMTRAEVIEKLGEPRLELEELGICTSGTWLGDCEAAGQSGAVRFLIWKYGIDTYFVIGLDADSRVVFHDMGDA